MLCGVVLAFVLPSGPQSAWFLKPIEKEVAVLRLEQDSVSTVETKFNWTEAFGEFYTPHGYLRCALAFCGGILLTSNANFLAMVVARLGYDVVKTNLVSHAFVSKGALLASRLYRRLLTRLSILWLLRLSGLFS